VQYEDRQKRLRDVLRQSSLDALLLTHLPNVRYLCGFTGSAAALLVTHDKTVFFTDGRYTTQAKDEVIGARLVTGRMGPLALFSDWMKSNVRSRKPLRLGIETGHMTVAEHRQLTMSLPKAIRLRRSPPLVEQMRMVKDIDEISRMRSAAQLGCRLFDVTSKTIRPGVKETGIAAAMQHAASQAGAEGMSFDTIIAAGERSALPHGRASAQSIPPDGFVVCDFGVILAGYCSDMTRTVYVGSPGAEARSIYGAVLESQLAAVEAIKPGRSVGEVDQVARKVLQKHKLARYFTHSTGHGVGLEIHEAPRLATGQQEILRPGMVVTVEPGAYIPRKWGVRIEDMVVVTETGCEILTPTNKELIVV
jgi:Xaa-Pro aminopeptidase